MKGRGGKHLAHLIVHHRGRKGVRDAELARECGFTEAWQMYRQLGQKLLLLSRSCWFELRPEKPGSDENRPRPVYIFTLSGVMMITAWLATERALNVGRALASLLGTRRRASKNRQRRPRRADDPSRQRKYQSSLARLELASSRVEKKVELSIGPAR